MAKRKNPNEFDPFVTISNETRLAWIAKRGDRTLRDIANAMRGKLTHGAVSHIEQGHTRQIHLSVYVALVKVLYGASQAAAEAQAAEVMEADRQRADRLAQAFANTDRTLGDSLIRVMEDSAKKK